MRWVTGYFFLVRVCLSLLPVRSGLVCYEMLVSSIVATYLWLVLWHLWVRFGPHLTLGLGRMRFLVGCLLVMSVSLLFFDLALGFEMYFWVVFHRVLRKDMLLWVVEGEGTSRRVVSVVPYSYRSLVSLHFLILWPGISKTHCLNSKAHWGLFLSVTLMGWGLGQSVSRLDRSVG
jgi:hypothetical protein